MYRREEEGVLLDFLMVPWAMVRWGLWVGHWLLVFAQWVIDWSCAIDVRSLW